MLLSWLLFSFALLGPLSQGVLTLHFIFVFILCHESFLSSKDSCKNYKGLYFPYIKTSYVRVIKNLSSCWNKKVTGGISSYWVVDVVILAHNTEKYGGLCGCLFLRLDIDCLKHHDLVCSLELMQIHSTWAQRSTTRKKHADLSSDFHLLLPQVVPIQKYFSHSQDENVSQPFECGYWLLNNLFPLNHSQHQTLHSSHCSGADCFYYRWLCVYIQGVSWRWLDFIENEIKLHSCTIYKGV